MTSPVPTFTWNSAVPPYPEYEYFREKLPFGYKSAPYCIDASILAYADPDFAWPVFTKAGFKRVAYLDRQGTQCYVVEKDGILLVAFRGTQSNVTKNGKHRLEVLMDSWTDIDFIMVERKGAYVHEGFASAHAKVWPDLLALIQNRLVIFTGHSLGGALATYSAFKHRFSSCVVSLHTFGAPCVGNKDFVQAMDERLQSVHFRYTHNRDGVPSLPPKNFGFEHCGTHIHFGEDPPHNPVKFKRGCLGSIFPVTIGTIPGWIYDHIPLLYAWHIWERYNGDGSAQGATG